MGILNSYVKLPEGINQQRCLATADFLLHLLQKFRQQLSSHSRSISLSRGRVVVLPRKNQCLSSLHIYIYICVCVHQNGRISGMPFTKIFINRRCVVWYCLKMMDGYESANKKIIYQLNATMNLHWLLPYFNPFEYFIQKKLDWAVWNKSLFHSMKYWFIGIAL